MRKHFILLIFIASTTITVNAQSGKNIRIGYIDMEYILENVPEYSEANIQLEQKAQKWKQEMETKKNEISKLKESLKTEIAERQKALEDRKAAREKMLEDRKAAFEAKRKEAEANKIKLQEERKAKKAETTVAPPATPNTDTDKKSSNSNEIPKTPDS